MKIYDNQKRWGWIKLHIDVDPKTQEPIAIKGTDDKVADCTIFPKLIDKSPKTVQKVFADGAHDKSSCRKISIWQRSTSLYSSKKTWKNPGWSRDRIHKWLFADHTKFSEWQRGVFTLEKLVGYDKRSFVEIAFSRLKRDFGERLSNKTNSNLKAEITFRSHVLNRMNLT